MPTKNRLNGEAMTVRAFTLVALYAGIIATPLLAVTPAASAVSGTLLVRTDLDCTLSLNGKPRGTLASGGEGTAVDLTEGRNTIACTADDGTRLAVIAFAHRGDKIPGAYHRVEQLNLEIRQTAERWRGVAQQSGNCRLEPPSAADPVVGNVYDDSAEPMHAIMSCVNAGFHKSQFALEPGSRFHVADPVQVLRRCTHCPDLIAIDIEPDSPVDPAPGALYIAAPPPCVLTDQIRGYVEVDQLRCLSPRHVVFEGAKRLRELALGRNASAVDQDGNDRNAPFERYFHFNPDGITRIVDSSGTVVVENAQPFGADDSE